MADAEVDPIGRPGKKLNVVGMVGLIVFYLIIFFAGILSHKVLRRKSRKDIRKMQVESKTEDMMLAGRDINYFVGVFTMTATWVGGGYINGTAESVLENGLVWTLAPVGYSIAMFLGGLFFAEKMRKRKFVTMLDPLQEKYGKPLGALFYIPAFSGEILWSASILAALGTSLRVICGIDDTTSIIASAAIAMTYTLFGGLYSVAFTDVFQLICIFFGLIFAIPFMVNNPNVEIPLRSSNLTMFMDQEQSYSRFIGKLEKEDAGVWVDQATMLMLGGIPWQAYFQRVLSARDVSVAKTLSFAAAPGCFAAAIPPVVIGLIAMNTDWPGTDYGENLIPEDYKLAVPLTLLYLTPPAVAFIGLGAVSAAVMSSTDSSILGVSTLFTRNVFVNVFYQKATDKFTVWFLRGTVFVNTVIAMIIAIFVKTVYGLYLICSDLVYILLFPHLYGMIAGFSVALILRVLSGEPVLKYNALLKFPGYVEPDQSDGSYGRQRFPFRNLIVILNFLITLSVTYLSKQLFAKYPDLQKYDILEGVRDQKTEKREGLQNEKEGEQFL
ncbi:high affinity choline transporter 1-like [Bolinopsis microptera]|uniref:high affinity choline transporter 1-like n=1 Tax=Bolinopsis microptera TaxID=2820187 RepID=UPI00307A3A8E